MLETLRNMLSETWQKIFDYAAISTMIGTLMGWMPSMAATASFIWACIRIWETESVQKLVGRKK
ncbi:hypothetical protein [Shumkonia mesophila]|uniref:hypothetical protein n=1 Tax=Shumkonia mesophila TaxID=2838854 RepID=UPI002934DD52|nr:hypothetical protein [Shumkonia mesophila]